MVISQLMGGLGNQMFQYAAGRALSLQRDVPFRLDVSGFKNYALHQGFELERIFNCSAIATQQDMKKILGWQSAPFIRRLVSHSYMAVFRCKNIICEPHFNYWQEINDSPMDNYLVGYWQSEKYFIEVAQQIRKDFTFRLPINSLNASVLQKISKVNAVSLHVRRGDYATNSKTMATHGLCSLDYYGLAIEHIAKHVQKPHFFVFSDDIAWAKTNLKVDFPIQYVDHNFNAESYNDMRLMSLCQHHIIANSSFSWWGAWLNPCEKKIVIAPNKWFAHEANIEDLIPKEWSRI